MMQKITIGISGILLGLLVGYVVVFYTPFIFPTRHTSSLSANLGIQKKEVIGFLPFWLLGKANNDYAKYITTLSYFNLTIGKDGSIVKLVNEQEEDPGWHTLQSGSADGFFSNAKKNMIALSLVIFNGDNDVINSLLADPTPHARNLVRDVMPLMRKYGFTDLNLDIEQTNEASSEAAMHFTQFVKGVKNALVSNHLGTLTVEASPTDLIKKRLVDVKSIAPYVDRVVIMAYDYHYAGSSVTGAVAPLSGAGKESEFDTQVALQKAEDVMPSEKIILGVPLYGYAWETIDTTPHSAIIPGTGIISSSKRTEQFLDSCATCSSQFDQIAGESYSIYPDNQTGTQYQIFYPDKKAMTAKINLATGQELGGLALWALGYEDTTILEPLTKYK